MEILRFLLSAVQSLFNKRNKERAEWFVATLLLVMLPVSGSRGSQLLRGMRGLFGIEVSSRRFYSFLASPKLPWRRLWRRVWELIPSPLTDGFLLLAGDDSVTPRTGRKIHGCDHHYDHAHKANQSTYVWGQNLVFLGLLKRIHGRFACIPLSFRFYRLKKAVEASQFKTKLEQMVEMVIEVAASFKQPILLVVDAWFGNDSLFRPLRDALGEQFTLLSRLRASTTLYALKTPTKVKKRGRPALYGQKLGNVRQMAFSLKEQAVTTQAFLYGKVREIKAIEQICLLKTLKRPVKIVFVYYKKSWVALFSTNTALSLPMIIEYYGARWKIESGFKELKHDIGSQHTQARNVHAVTNHLQFCTMATALTWLYADYHMQPPPARHHPAARSPSFSFADVRRAIANDFNASELNTLLPKTAKLPKNNLINLIVQIAA